MPLTVRIAAGVFTLVLCAPPLCAQTTRVEVLERERAAKATDLREYTPGRLEKWLLRGEQNDLFARIAPRNGFFVRYGYPEKPVGAGIGLGGGYRHDLFERRARVVAEAGFSLRRYSLLRADVSLPYLARERAEIGVEVSRRQNAELQVPSAESPVPVECPGAPDRPYRCRCVHACALRRAAVRANHPRRGARAGTGGQGDGPS